MFKKVMAFAAVAVLSCSVAFGAEFTVSNQFPPSHHISKAIHVFADKVVELSGGQLKVNVADSGSLYNDSQILEAVQDGLVEVGLVGTYKWGGMVPAADVFDLPFLFVDLSSPEKFLNAGAADILDAEFNKKGVKNLFWVDYGFIQMWNNEHPLHSPKDFEGLTMRSYSAGDSITLKALGAAPTLISSAEMYMAIQNGTVKGATTGMPAAVSRKIYEVSKYLTIANYSTAQFSVQANLSGHHYISQLFRRKYSGSRKYSRCQRKIKTCALLPDIRRCQIYGDSLGWERDPVILEGCTYTILRFFYLGRWQSDHSKGRKSITYICFNLYKMNFHPRNSC